MAISVLKVNATAQRHTFDLLTLCGRRAVARIYGIPSSLLLSAISEIYGIAGPGRDVNGAEPTSNRFWEGLGDN
jgi:hypothetical protein